MKNIHIVPVFNQSEPLIWSTFVGIQKSAMRTVYRYKMPMAEMASEITNLATSWKQVPCFAFAAYDDNKMVGFARGTFDSVCANIHGLYVLPKYQKMGIGSRLLTASERFASVYVESINLIALYKSIKFYQKHNFVAIELRNGLCSKNIKYMGRGQIVPLFVCSDAVGRHCGTIARNCGFDFDKADVNSKHLPMFVYLNQNMKIGGYILGAQPGAWTDYRISKLCVDATERPDVARCLIENLAQMNIR